MSLHKQENVILLKLDKNKEVLASNGGGKREKKNPFVVLILESNPSQEIPRHETIRSSFEEIFSKDWFRDGQHEWRQMFAMNGFYELSLEHITTLQMVWWQLT